MTIDIPERIVCAANKYGDLVITGVRHGCDAMCDSIDEFLNNGNLHQSLEVQGFVTNKYRFVDRIEAWKIAEANNQILRRVGGDSTNGGTLYSENLY